MLKLLCSLCIVSISLLNAQDDGLVRISQPLSPEISSALFGDQTQAEKKAAEEKAVAEAAKAEVEAAKTKKEVSVELASDDLPLLEQLPNTGEITDPLSLLTSLEPLPVPIVDEVVVPLKKKVNGKYVITSKRSEETRFEVREVNGRKVIYPK